MPPKAKLREDDFHYSEDRSHVQCKACGSSKWIAVKSAAKHLTSVEHLKTVELGEDARKRREELEKERQTDSATTELRSIQFAASRLPSGPIGSTSSGLHARSEAEVEMWEAYESTGAAFSAGEDPDDTHIHHKRLREEVESFGVQNPEAAARNLGFGDGDVAAEMLAEDEEEDFLSEIMRNAGECRIELWHELVVWFRPNWDHHMTVRVLPPFQTGASRLDFFASDRVTSLDSQSTGIEDPNPEEIQADGSARSGSDPKWFPYPSKLMFLLDTLSNLPRLRISSSLMRVFLWVLKEAGCKDVPSFDHLRRVQKSLRADCGVPTIPCKSVQGNVFFMNDPAAIVAQDWANPTIRKLIHVFPEIPKDGIIREIWHAQKWRKNMDLDMLSPMYDSRGSHYYVNEVSRLKNGNFVIPIRWVICNDKVHADVFSISFNDQEGTSLVCSEEFVENYLDLLHVRKIPKWAAGSIEAGHSARMPNLKRALAGGDPLYCSFVDYFGDDVSGNRTKSWNKHWNAYMTHRNLPRECLQQEFHTHFISTSPNASVTEQFNEFKSRVEATHVEPVKVRDESGGTTRFCIHVNAGPSDNPMQSEISGHIGGKGNRFCRKCEVGGTQKEKAANEGYHLLFEPGIPRTKERVLDELQKQVKLACSGVSQHVKDAQTQTGVKDAYTQYWIDDLIARFKNIKKDNPNRSSDEIQVELIQWTVENHEKIYSPFLTMKGFDPTKDTPVEILHTILLGIVKYIWHVSHTAWSAEKKKTYAVRLQSTATDGLSIHAIRANYIMQYAGSLIGRQFKTIAQTNVFHVRGLVTDYQFMAWKATGELAALLWFPEIRDLVEYRRDLKVTVANVLDVFSMIDPSKIITKIKYHLLVHIDEDAVEFGPLLGVITEIYECFNAIFRFCSILSNHLAPSRDIAIQLGDQEGLKHRLTGGWWYHNNEWQKAGPGVCQFMAKHPVLQKLLGWSEPKTLVHGNTKPVPTPRGQIQMVIHELQSTSAAHAVNFGMYSAVSMWTKCREVISESLDPCFIGSWVFAESATEKGITVSGRISEILQGDNSIVVLVVELFQVLSSRDEIYGMPVLVRRDSEITYSIIPAKNLKFKFNVQHDCYSAKCEATGVRMQMQERVESDKIENYIVHNSLDRYIINSHAFHNAHLLRATLPRDLLAPILLFPDRRVKHDELASDLRETLDTKRTKRAAAAEQKRKASPMDNGDDSARPRKRARTRVASSTVPAGETMVGSRGKRKITRTAKAMEMAEETVPIDDSSDDADLYDDPDSGDSD
ncbi:hypothetical protein C8J57DRAFT_1709000 [Mycena rebaudengoi]|nr:hypothetical protein C8J57DRAFT_1709000 [Mycena rebaudengoi]